MLVVERVFGAHLHPEVKEVLASVLVFSFVVNMHYATPSCPQAKATLDNTQGGVAFRRVKPEKHSLPSGRLTFDAPKQEHEEKVPTDYHVPLSICVPRDTAEESGITLPMSGCCAVLPLDWAHECLAPEYGIINVHSSYDKDVDIIDFFVLNG
jgi:hypothetical protein